MSGADWLAGGLGLAFAGAGAANIMGIGSVKEDFRHWGYPAGFYRVTGMIELAGALLLLYPVTRTAAALLLGATMVAALATLMRHRAAIGHMIPAALLVVGLIILLAIG